jgi:hypothetical protein
MRYTSLPPFLKMKSSWLASALSAPALFPGLPA